MHSAHEGYFLILGHFVFIHCWILLCRLFSSSAFVFSLKWINFNTLKDISFKSQQAPKFCSASLKHYVPKSSFMIVEKNAPSIFAGIVRVFTQKGGQHCQGSRLWDQGITLLIKIQVALLPMGIQCTTLDWIRWWQPRPFVFCAWRKERNLSRAVLLYTKTCFRNACERSVKAVSDL